MVAMQIILDGDGCWPDLKDRKVIHIKDNMVSLALIKKGMKSGKSSISFRIDIDDKRTVIFETSFALLESAVKAFTIADQQDNQNPSTHCLATYQCKACGHKERIWNSRTGVTPFCVPCINCKKPNTTAHHVDWDKDTYEPDYQPQQGERIFITWSRKSIEAHLRSGMVDLGFDVITETEQLHKLIEEGYENGIHPNLITVDKCATCKFKDDNWECTEGYVVIVDLTDIPCSLYEKRG
ncbi:hypothetical protein LCGC14_0957570 [marine sediment metagenome]|uniref:Uncharacterized protein n=1 Tax=marine sediment metagenome TaxID=412755 RepID=A0A0F9RLZ6_9ZZZZ